MACDASKRIGTPPQYPNPNDGVEQFSTDCVAYDFWFVNDCVPSINEMYPCMNQWYIDTLTLRNETEGFRDTTFGYMNTTKDYRDDAETFATDADQSRQDAQTIVDGISTQLPTGTLSDNTIETTTTWSSVKINAELKTLGFIFIEDEDENWVETNYSDGAKEKPVYLANGEIDYIFYTETDGTTERYRLTFNYNVSGKFLGIDRS